VGKGGRGDLPVMTTTTRRATAARSELVAVGTAGYRLGKNDVSAAFAHPTRRDFFETILHPPRAPSVSPSASRRAAPKDRMEIDMKLSRTVLLATVASLAIAGAAVPTIAQQMQNEQTVTVGGSPMYPSKNIIQNAVNSKDHTTLVAAVKAAGLVDTLQTPGPFTVFAPTNAAFAKLPAGTVDALLKPEAKGKLTAVLTYHVVPGRLSAKDLMEAAKKNGGIAELKTVEGETLKVESKGNNQLTIWDSKGNVSKITIQNVFQSNGVIHVIDSVLLPSA
jgi:uncharacterized surface protein with fasciclin (FAS1) repeats